MDFFYCSSLSLSLLYFYIFMELNDYIRLGRTAMFWKDPHRKKSHTVSDSVCTPDFAIRQTCVISRECTCHPTLFLESRGCVLVCGKNERDALNWKQNMPLVHPCWFDSGTIALLIGPQRWVKD